jgi:hypothetical protein
MQHREVKWGAAVAEQEVLVEVSADLHPKSDLVDLDHI